MDGTIRLCEVATGEERTCLSAGSRSQSMRVHPDGHKLAVSNREKRHVQVWDLETGELAETYSSHPASPWYIAYSPDGKLLAAGCTDYNVYVWNTTTGQQQAVMRGHRGEVVAVAFCHGGNLLASAGWDATTRLWEPASGSQLVSVNGYFRQFSRDGGRMLVKAGSRAEVWEVVTSGRECVQLWGHVGGKRPASLDICPHGRLAASSREDGVRLWDLAANTEIGHLPLGDTPCTFFCPDGNSLITYGASGLYRWSIREDTDEQALRVGPPEVLGASTAPHHLRQATVTADGKWMASVVGPREAGVLALENGGETVVLQGEDGVEYATISPDGKWAVTSTFKSSPHRRLGYEVWDVEAEKPIKHLAHVSGAGHARAAFHPNGKWLVTASGEEYRFWKVGSWELGHRISREYGAPGVLSFTRDGKTLAIAHSRDVIQLLDGTTFRQLAAFESPGQRNLNWLCLSPDGDHLAAACMNHLVLVWDLRAIRQQLAPMGLDWDLPPYPPTERRRPSGPLRVKIDMGEL